MNNSFFERLRFKFRVSVLNENTLGEVWHFRISRFGLFMAVIMFLVLTFALFALLIWYTPLRNYLPGYNGNIRQELVHEIARVDSLNTQIALQTDYLKVIQSVVSGEVLSDSVQPLDSLAVVRQREQLLEAKNSVTEEFISQYEAKEKDNLTMFEVQSSTPVYTVFRPVHGVIEQQFDKDENQYGITLRTPKNENVMAVLPGSVVYAARTIDNEWMIMIQHENDYISIYKNNKVLLKKVGDSVRAGESIAIVSDSQLFYFELWQKGFPINPEEIIAF